ncbi:putative multidrug efflux transcriptional regulator CeoR [soil metagenome]
MAIDRLHAMRTFSRVVELGSFTRAAVSLGLPKASVSTTVANLEGELGVRLLNRTTRHVSVTLDGAAYYERVIRILAEIEDTEASLKSASSAPRGRLRLDMPTVIARSVIVPALSTFIAQYPDIELVIGASDRPVDLLEEGVDCVIRGGGQTDSTLVSRRLGDFRVIRCAAPSYLDRFGRPGTIEELRLHRAIHYFASRTGKVWEFDYLGPDGKPLEIPMEHRLSFNEPEACYEACVLGLGVAVLPSMLVQEALANGTLELVMPNFEPESIPVFIMYPQNRHLSAKVRVFVDWVAELFQTSDVMLQRSPLPRVA